MNTKLDEAAQAEICAILAVGGTRRMAAQYVGCTSRAIYYLVKRNNDFAQKLLRTELSPEIKFLKNISDAADEKKYWRAAAWALERMYPSRYAARKPETITTEHIDEITCFIVDAAMKQVPNPRNAKRLRAKLSAITKQAFAQPDKSAASNAT